jgi:hypothetical protein
MPRPTLQSQIDTLSRRADDADEMRAETHKMVTELYQALIVPQYGQGNKGLLERTADVVVAIEAGDRAAESLTKWAKRLAVIGALLLATGGVLLKLEIWKE